MKRNHRDLHAWQQAIELVAAIYALTSRFPDSERYGLTSQMRRAAVSVPSNIAEGAARASTRDLIRFLNIAAGSLSELDTLVAVAKKLGYVENLET
ncbi:MAG: four helix bundle protein, partial [Betaproteobacteria bacterium]|nr:four helix bundle protein [Betaproteobacteria bacterium]